MSFFIVRAPRVLTVHFKCLFALCPVGCGRTGAAVRCPHDQETVKGMSDSSFVLAGRSWSWVEAVWSPSCKAPVAAGRDVQLWCADVNLWSDRLGNEPSLLSDEESRRYASIGNLRRRRQFLTAHSLARLLAERCYERPYGESVAGAITDRPPAPPLPRPAATISVAHAGDCILLALCRRRVGVDVERPRAVDGYARIRRQLLPEPCRQALSAPNRSDDEQARLFARYWTAMEAAYKQEGRGLLLAYIRRMSLPAPDAQAQSRVGIHFAVCSTHIGALALADPVQRVHFFEADRALFACGD